MRSFTREELAANDGRNGQPTLVAVDGKVYDVSDSKLWKNGLHVKSHPAGRDHSLNIQASPHGYDVLEGREPVGLLVDSPAVEKFSSVTEAREETPLIQRLVMSFHPHPVSVHFPIALSMSASAFLVLRIVLDRAEMETVAFYCLVAAAITTPPAVCAGLLSWIFVYARAWTPLFRKKLVLSAILMVLQIAAVIFRFHCGAPDSLLTTPHLWYFLMTLATVPLVAWLGYLGGKITFQS